MENIHEAHIGTYPAEPQALFVPSCLMDGRSECVAKNGGSREASGESDVPGERVWREEVRASESGVRWLKFCVHIQWHCYGPLKMVA
jgi:hypothetical protein